eukprot:4760300-Pyramimonas_sp.AAC.1
MEEAGEGRDKGRGRGGRGDWAERRKDEGREEGERKEERREEGGRGRRSRKVRAWPFEEVLGENAVPEG